MLQRAKARETRRAARAAPYEKGTETLLTARRDGRPLAAARAAPYEKGTETEHRPDRTVVGDSAARAAPYEKGTETASTKKTRGAMWASRARGPL